MCRFMGDGSVVPGVSVSTPELRTGDLVYVYGMFVRLGPVKVWDSGNPVGPAYTFAGLVENGAEIHAQWPNHVVSGLLRRDNTWTVQGNRLASWFRVDES